MLPLVGIGRSPGDIGGPKSRRHPGGTGGQLYRPGRHGPSSSAGAGTGEPGSGSAFGAGVNEQCLGPPVGQGRMAAGSAGEGMPLAVARQGGPPVAGDREARRTELAALYPGVSRILPVSGRTGEGVDDWLDLVLGRPVDDVEVLDIDYRTYAEAEAELGWLNAACELRSSQPHNPSQIAETVEGCMADRLAAEAWNWLTSNCWSGRRQGRAPAAGFPCRVLGVGSGFSAPA